MTELTRAGGTGVKRLVLGFDAGCGTCSDLAQRIQERIGEKLVVRNLRDPEVEGWREEALGKAAPWAPTLFEVEGEKVRAWVGVKMGLALSRRLGPSDTWRVMQLLGEIGAAPRIEAAVEESAVVNKLPEKAQEAVAGISRGQFLKGVGGAAVAASLLSGGPLALTAEAATTSPYDVVKSRKMTGTELTNAARQVGASVDVKNLVGLVLSTPAKVAAAKPVGFMHTLRNGTLQRVIIFNLGSAGGMISHVEFAAPPRSVARARAFRQRKNGSRWVITKASEGGRLWRVAARSSSQTQGSRGVMALSECPPIQSNPPGNNNCYRIQRVCVDWAFGYSCGLSVVGTALSCPSCATALYATYATFGAAAKAIGIACGGCATSAGGLGSCCVQWCDVQLWDTRPGCGFGP